LTSTGDVVICWKEYFEDLLNHVGTSSIEEAEAEGSEVDSSITLAQKLGKSTFPQSTLSRLQMVQNEAARLLTGTKNGSISLLFLLYGTG